MLAFKLHVVSLTDRDEVLAVVIPRVVIDVVDGELVSGSADAALVVVALNGLGSGVAVVGGVVRRLVVLVAALGLAGIVVGAAVLVTFGAVGGEIGAALGGAGAWGCWEATQSVLARRILRSTLPALHRRGDTHTTHTTSSVWLLPTEVRTGHSFHGAPTHTTSFLTPA